MLYHSAILPHCANENVPNICVSREHLLRMRELASEFGCVSFTSLDPDIVCWEKETDVEGECEFDSN